MKKRKKSISLTKEELNLIDEVTYLEPGLDDVVRRARGKGDCKRTYFDFDDDLKDCRDALDHHAHFMLLPRVEAMIALADRLKDVYDKE
jgi:hypothetical protein